MKRINLLDMETSNKIAAGEVVERPASVVKELIENSIDAGAKNISVEISDGGERLIKIVDDGQGIHPEDIEKAFLPHATSKIEKVEELFTIRTMGFRGEALASVAAVSKVKLISRTEEFSSGKEISIHGGVIEYIKDVGCNIGTTIEVGELFYNVPARLKFLKTPIREAAIITDIIERLSIANDTVAFKLISNDKKIINTFGSGNVCDTIRSIYGKKIFDNTFYFEKHSDTASIYGYLGNSEISRGSRNNQSIFVNKRYIKSKLVTVAVEGAYKSFLTVHKFPFFILFLDIYSEFLDINVHPTKSEVKFKDERIVFKLVFDAVHAALTNIYKTSLEYNNSFKCDEAKVEAINPQTVQLPIDLKGSLDFKYKNESMINNNYTVNEEKDNLIEPPSFKLATSDEKPLVTSMAIEKEKREYKLPRLKIIGQLLNTYILTEGEEGLFIIDQHAAHEKIIFERYLKEIESSQVVSQLLLIPVLVELSGEDYVYYIENHDFFHSAGFNIEQFGDRTVAIREVPFVLGKPDYKNLFSDIIDNLKNMGSGKTMEIKYDKIAKLACKAAVKANNVLSQQEMSALIEELGYAESPFTCPHGRPTIIKMATLDIEKKFKRIQ